MVHTLKNVLEQNVEYTKVKDYKKGSYPQPYKRKYFELFDENLHISNNFSHTTTRLNPVFDKTVQKPAEQVLVLKEGSKITATMISSLEGDFFKKYIDQHKPANLWLVLPSGHSYTQDPPFMSEEDSKVLKKLLWQVKLFNGDVEALINDENTPEMIRSLDPKLLSAFLQLKVEGSSQRKVLFQEYFSKLIGGDEIQTPSEWLAKAMGND